MCLHKGTSSLFISLSFLDGKLDGEASEMVFWIIEARSAVAAVRARIPGIIRKTYSAPITALLISFRYFSVRPLMYFCVFCAALVSTPTSLYISVKAWFCSV